MSQRTLLWTTIPNGTALSPEVNVDRLTIVGLQMPAAWTAASITFAALTTGTTYGKVQDQGGTELAITSPAADTYISVAPTIALRGLGRIKVRSGTAATPVNQGADRSIGIVCIDETQR